MVELILTEDQRTQCSMQTLDLVTKAAVAGAIGFVLYHAFVKEGVWDTGTPGRFLKRFAGKFSHGKGAPKLSIPKSTRGGDWL